LKKKYKIIISSSPPQKMKLFSVLGTLHTNKVLVTADVLGLPVELVNIQLADLQKEEFLKKNPNGKCPILETKDGSIYESNAIVRFLAREKPETKLYGESHLE